MAKTVFAVLLFFLVAPIGSAQAPPIYSPASVKENLSTFTSWDAEIRKVDSQWELWAGRVKIKDLGNRETDAREALRLIRMFNLNQRGTVGKPLPVMEYWLSDGRAPQKMGRLNSVPIDPDALQVVNCQGQWCLIDPNRPWFTFGAEADEARKALEIIQKYQFTDVLYVGTGNPAMIVFVAGSDKNSKSEIRNPKTVNSSNFGFRISDFKWFQPPQLHVNTTLVEPVTGNAMLHFDWRQAAIRCEKMDWQVVADGQVLARFGSRELEARQALRAVQALHLTDRCQIGDGPPVLTFFLSDGEPTHGLFFSAKNQSCHPEELILKRLGLRWTIWEYDSPLLALGKNQEEAQQILQILQHYKVDHICQIGSSDPPPVTILVRRH
jgi:hypothetical protein